MIPSHTTVNHGVSQIGPQFIPRNPAITYSALCISPRHHSQSHYINSHICIFILPQLGATQLGALPLRCSEHTRFYKINKFQADYHYERPRRNKQFRAAICMNPFDRSNCFYPGDSSYFIFHYATKAHRFLFQGKYRLFWLIGA